MPSESFVKEDKETEVSCVNKAPAESDNSTANNNPFCDGKKAEETEEGDINSSRNVSNVASRIATMIDEINS